MSDAESARTERIPPLLIQGTSTIPPSGSHVRPRRFLSPRAAALKHCSGVPPRISVRAQADIAIADPISAWHPPSAPARVAFSPIIIPRPEAANNPSTNFLSENLYFFWAARKTPGITPAAPAVGKATIRPIRAFVSLVAIAYVIESSEASDNIKFFFCFLSPWASFFAFSPAMPPTVFVEVFSPFSTASLITLILSPILFTICSLVLSLVEISFIRTISQIGFLYFFVSFNRSDELWKLYIIIWLI
jgi:hypothetical protein